MIKILLAEDDENLAFVVEDNLTELGYEVIATKDGQEAAQKFRSNEINLCIIDVMMPKMDGFTLAEDIRSINEFVPIIFLTARSHEEDRLRGFVVGGDDYVLKPFSMAELAHRIDVFLRRTPRLNPPALESTRIGTFEYVEAKLELIGAGTSHSLTQMEGDLLSLLIRNKNRLIKREDILIEIWGENDYFKGRSLDVFISRLRKYLREDPQLEIRNHHGVGFSLIDGNLSG